MPRRLIRDVAYRAWVEPVDGRGIGRRKRGGGKRQPGFRSLAFGDRVLVLDTETTTDRFQNLLFGSYAVYQRGKLVTEGLFHGDAPSPAQLESLQLYARERGLPLLVRADFVGRIFYPEIWKLGTTLLCFNLPFDLTRLAVHAAPSRQPKWRRAFTVSLSWNYQLPRIRIKAINAKASFIEFAPPKNLGRFSFFKGNFLDLRTAMWALTGQSHSLDSACRESGVEHPKQRAARHGVVAAEYVDYCRRDVLSTWEVYLAVLREFELHPLDLDLGHAYSPASLGKAYLRKMGVQSLLELSPRFSRRLLGIAMATYHGGRAEVHIRRKVVPITHLDVKAMYPTLYVLQGLWWWTVAQKLEAYGATDEVRSFLSGLTPEALFDQATWKQIPGLVLVRPKGDVLPIRTRNPEGTWGLSLSAVTSVEPVWATLADCIGSKLLTGKAPEVVKAIKIRPVGVQAGLKPVKLRGQVTINPATEDFFKKVVEERERAKRLGRAAPTEEGQTRAKALADFLKLLANSTAYGITVEFIREDLDHEAEFVVYGQGKPYRSGASAYERPGPFCNPLVGTMITSGAWLMLAMMESFLVDRGAAFAFCDTDSIAVAS
jgi:hypothetical protein